MDEPIVFFSPLGLVRMSEIGRESKTFLIQTSCQSMFVQTNYCYHSSHGCVSWKLPRVSPLYTLYGHDRLCGISLSPSRGPRRRLRLLRHPLPKAQVIGMDMFAPFGWNDSPNMYCVFGDEISWLVRRESPHQSAPLYLMIDNSFGVSITWMIPSSLSKLHPIAFTQPHWL